jgi:glutamine cyclotransferase
MFHGIVLGIFLLFAAVSLADRANAQQSDHGDGYQIIHTYPHDPDAYTQGLVYVDGHLYESTGRYGKSSIRMFVAEHARLAFVPPHSNSEQRFRFYSC